MTIKSLLKAVKYTDNALGQYGHDRGWVHSFWVEHTPQGQAVRSASTYGHDPIHVWDDQLFISVIVDNVQRFVFGDEGDQAMDVPASPATEDEVDGMVGPLTIRRMETWLEYIQDEIEPLPDVKTSDYIMWGKSRIDVPGVEILSLNEPEGLDLVAQSLKKWKRRKGYTPWPTDNILDLAGQDPKWARLLGFVHWDAGWSAGGAFKILIRRGLGSTCGIDRPRKSDGKVVVYQWLDPSQYYGWHGSSANPRSLFSFDMSNAVYGKYAAKYQDLCGIKRPLIQIDRYERIGSGKVFLGMYKEQILSLLRILKALSKYTGLPYHWPITQKGEFQGRNYKRLWKDDFHGVAEHRHLPTTTKWDCRGLFAQICALILSEGSAMLEFPELVETHRLQDSHWGPWLDKVKEHWEWDELWNQ